MSGTSTTSARRYFVACTLATMASVALLHPSDAFAQHAPAAGAAAAIGVHGIGIIGPKPLLGERLYGAGLVFDIPLRSGRSAFRLAADVTRSATDRIGVPCGGLIQPGTCAPEPVRDRAQFAMISAGLSRRVIGSVQNGVALTVDVALALAHVETTGVASGRTLPASKTFWGGTAGAEAFWTPVANVPVMLTLGAAAGGLTPVRESQFVDGYSPFEQGFGVGRMYIGTSWRPRVR